MAKPRKENLSKAKAIMAAMLGMKPKPHGDMKLGAAKDKQNRRAGKPKK